MTASGGLPAALARPDSYPHRPQAVEVHETHISWVFLAGDRAYKLKKPLVFPFLDYGTPERRLEMCRAEVRLNRRLGGDLYVGVRGVATTQEGIDLTADDDPRAIDYLVEMHRYDEQSTLASALKRDDLAEPQVAEVGRKLARFHAACTVAQPSGRGSYRVEREVDSNVAELLDVAEQERARALIRDLARFMSAFVSARRGQFDDRATRGLIREGHGDLRAEHVLLRPSLRVVDCIEFDKDLRTLDVADDLAFLVMDLCALAGERFTAHLTDAYRSAGGDCGDDALLAFYATHRALVRAKVLLVRGSQLSRRSDARSYAIRRARELLEVADSLSWHARLPLVLIICGVPASGKTYLARVLAETTGLPHIGTDLTRKQLAGVEPHRMAPTEIYTPEWNTRTYAELGRLTTRAVTERGGAIVDGTFRHVADREVFASYFGRAAPCMFVECQVPQGVLAARAASREREPPRISDADLEVVLREHSRWDTLDEVSADSHLIVRTDRRVDETLADVRSLLDGRIGRDHP